MRSRIQHQRIAVLIALVAAVTAAAQTPVFQPMMPGHKVVAMEVVDGRLFAGLAKGGLVEWDLEAETATRYMTRADGIGGHLVQDLDWSGSRLLVATADGGLTAISNPGRDNEFIQLYRDGLAALDVTAVSGQQIGDSERIYYGTQGDGIGVIDGGREGAYYSVNDGLINDTVVDLALSGNLLLVATPVGISRFADNEFTSYPYVDVEGDAVRDLEVAADGTIWAVGPFGVAIWNDEARVWANVLDDSRYRSVACDGGITWALNPTGDLLTRIEAGSTSDIPLPAPPVGHDRTFYAVAGAAGESWVGGLVKEQRVPVVYTEASHGCIGRTGSTSTTVDVFATCRIGVGGGFDGVAFDSSGRAWAGDRSGDGLVGFSDDGWYNVDPLAVVEPDSAGLFNLSGGLLALAGDGDAVWFNQFTVGAIRYVPADAPGGVEEWTLVTPDDSPMLVDGIRVIEVHPDGVALFSSNDSDYWGTPNSLYGVDILLDAENPRRESSWTHVYPSDLGGNNIYAITVEQRDVVWFSVLGQGLVRWDINGILAGPEGQITWTDTSDDDWSYLPTTLSGGQLELTGTNAIVIDSEGSIWAGGTGLVRFDYSPALDLATLRGEWVEKSDGSLPGLLNQAVHGLAFDQNRDLWVLSEGGLDRFRISDNSVTVDSFTDLLNFGNLDQRFYSASAIVPLPGGTYRELGVSNDGTQLVVSSDVGASVITVPERMAVASPGIAESYLFPNPFPGDEGADGLSLGGLEIDSDNPAVVEILNLSGQIVFRSSRVTSADGIWDGRNRSGERVSSGLYVVKVAQADRTIVRTLAIAF